MFFYPRYDFAVKYMPEGHIDVLTIKTHICKNRVDRKRDSIMPSKARVSNLAGACCHEKQCSLDKIYTNMLLTQYYSVIDK